MSEPALKTGIDIDTKNMLVNETALEVLNKLSKCMDTIVNAKRQRGGTNNDKDFPQAPYEPEVQTEIFKANQRSIDEFFNDVLSRCDSVHDFRGLVASQDLEKTLLDTNYIPSTREGVDDALVQEATELQRTPNGFNWLKNYELCYVLNQKTTGFETKVVHFFEHRYDKLEKNRLYLKSTENTFELDLNTHTGNTVDEEMKSKIGFVKLTNDTENVNVRDRVHAILKSYFNVNSSFAIDASVIRANMFPNKVVLASSIWDSATKPSNARDPEAEECSFETKNDSPNNVIYACESLTLNSSENRATLKYNDETKYFQLDFNTSRTHLAKLMSGEEYKNNKGVLYDIKRSGDGCQILQIHNLITQNKEKQYVLVTNDHLAFLKSRILGIPSVFTYVSQQHKCKVMVLFKNLVTNAEQNSHSNIITGWEDWKNLKQNSEYALARFEEVIRLFDETILKSIKDLFYLDSNADRLAKMLAIMSVLKTEDLDTEDKWEKIFRCDNIKDDRRKQYCTFAANRLRMDIACFLVCSVDMKIRKIQLQNLANSTDEEPEIPRIRNIRLYEWTLQENIMQKVQDYIQDVFQDVQHPIERVKLVANSFGLAEETRKDLRYVFNYTPNNYNKRVWNIMTKSLKCVCQRNIATRLSNQRKQSLTGKREDREQNETIFVDPVECISIFGNLFKGVETKRDRRGIEILAGCTLVTSHNINSLLKKLQDKNTNETKNEEQVGGMNDQVSVHSSNSAPMSKENPETLESLFLNLNKLLESDIEEQLVDETFETEDKIDMSDFFGSLGLFARAFEEYTAYYDKSDFDIWKLITTLNNGFEKNTIQHPQQIGGTMPLLLNMANHNSEQIFQVSLVTMSFVVVNAFLIKRDMSKYSMVFLNTILALGMCFFNRSPTVVYVVFILYISIVCLFVLYF
jgi:hypothetical protein